MSDSEMRGCLEGIVAEREEIPTGDVSVISFHSGYIERDNW
jgi:hypothetical protein